MRLLNTRNLELEFFAGGDIPPYAILSHTWEVGEVTFQELQGKSYNAALQGWVKIQRSAQLAAAQDLAYIWIDTCCIDKSSSAELSEAINSMFRWYEHAAVCYVYLVDVAAAGPTPVGFAASTGEGSSRWFSRGWTLQELIAPRHVEFYDRGWQSMGTRLTLKHAIHAVTGIPLNILLFSPTSGIPSVSRLLELTPVAERMSWAAKRVTTREEDTAYSLLGLFDVNMPLLYGEGRVKAFRRLQEEIILSTDDESIFVWRLDEAPRPGSNPFCGLLADGPERFGLFTDFELRRSQYLATQLRGTARSASRLGVRIDLPLAPFPYDTSGTIFLALLACDMLCRDRGEAPRTPALILQRAAHEDETRFMRVRADIVPLCSSNVIMTPYWLTPFIADLRVQQLRQVHNTDVQPWYYARRFAAFEVARPVSVFVPSTVGPSLTPRGILLFPALQDDGGSARSLLLVVSDSPTWTYFPDEMCYYEINFCHSPVPPVEEMTGPVVCGALNLLLEDRDSPRSSPGVGLPSTTRVCLVAGLEPLPANPFGTPGLYAVPWHAFEEPERAEAGNLHDAKNRDTRILELGWPFRVRAEFTLIVWKSGLFYNLRLIRC